jgi:hypothetical protein
MNLSDRAEAAPFVWLTRDGVDLIEKIRYPRYRSALDGTFLLLSDSPRSMLPHFLLLERYILRRSAPSYPHAAVIG